MRHLRSRVFVTRYSEMYSSNVTHLIDEFYDVDYGQFDLDPADDIVEGCVPTRSRYNLTWRFYVRLDRLRLCG